ncbi:hypothetical protein Zm00014a_003532 [Zea mays]|uniref:Uncharacterized protein n=1 Tax=Zea mays TaxID=4577 RepID=A0A3L6G500_MAIZE|nr:hypothetical protein Zm00014a_003532 [Zea mays]
MCPSTRRFAPRRQLPTTTEIQRRKRDNLAARNKGKVVPLLRCPTPRVTLNPSPVWHAVPALLEPEVAPARPPLLSTTTASRLSRTHRDLHNHLGFTLKLPPKILDATSNTATYDLLVACINCGINHLSNLILSHVTKEKRLRDRTEPDKRHAHFSKGFIYCSWDASWLYSGTRLVLHVCLQHTIMSHDGNWNVLVVLVFLDAGRHRWRPTKRADVDYARVGWFQVWHIAQAKPQEATAAEVCVVRGDYDIRIMIQEK